MISHSQPTKWKVHCPTHRGEAHSDSRRTYSRKTWAGSLSHCTRLRRRAEGNHFIRREISLTTEAKSPPQGRSETECAGKCGIKHIVVRGGFPAFSRNSRQGFRLLAGSHAARELKGGQFLDLQASMQRQSGLSDTLSKRCGQTRAVRVHHACLIPQENQAFY